MYAYLNLYNVMGQWPEVINKFVLNNTIDEKI